MSALRTSAFMLLAACLLASCDDASDGVAQDAAVQTDARVENDASDGDAAQRLREAVGTFGIELVAPGSTSIVGRVYEALPPSNMQWNAVEEVGDCTLFEPFNPFCDPACGSGAICVDDGTCMPPPASIDLGTVTLTGVGEDTISIEPLPPSNTYQPRGASGLPYPPFAEGDTVTLRASGGALLPFELSARGIAPLELSSTGPIAFDPEAETRVTWAPPDSDDGSRVIVTVDISHHGGRKGELVCETADDGELELPATLVQGLIDLGVAGFPTVTVTRQATNEPSTEAPRIQLRIFSEVDRELDIPGVTSCNEPGQQDVCPEGQTCQVNKLCR